MVDFMGFVLDGRGGFFSWWWWWWVSCRRGGGDGCLKERDSEEKIKGSDGRERERERERLYYIILLGSIYYFNELNKKIKVGILGVL